MKYLTRQRCFGILVAALVTLYFYACWVETLWVEVTHHSLPANISRPIKLAHVTDLHIRRFGRLERKVLGILEEEKPDAIFITGDSTVDPRGLKAVKDFLAQLKAPEGVWFVRGNWETHIKIPDERKTLEDLGIHFLLNEAKPLREDLWVVGLDDWEWGHPKIKESLSQVPEGVTRLALYHEPGLFNEMAGKINLGFAGHTHGGQIRLPFLPPLYLPPGCSGYVQGWYDKQGSRMYVSRGIGSSVLEARFLARPELPFITLHPK